MKHDPFKNLVLDEYEQEIEDSLVIPKTIPQMSKARRDELVEIARNTIAARKSQPITLRVSHDDLKKVKLKAEEHAIPYQTLISSLIHRFAIGKIRLDI